MSRKFDDDFLCTVKSGISVQRKPREEVGSCNACTSRNYFVVDNVDLRGMSFRLCNDCKKELISKLRGNK